MSVVSVVPLRLLCQRAANDADFWTITNDVTFLSALRADGTDRQLVCIAMRDAADHEQALLAAETRCRARGWTEFERAERSIGEDDLWLTYCHQLAANDDFSTNWKPAW